MENKNIVQNEKVNRPIFKTKVGNIDIAVWKHDGARSEYYTVSYSKNYLDEKNEWQKTTNLMISDIPNLQIGLQKAYEFAKVKE